MKLLTLGVLGYAIKNYLGNFKNSIIDSVDSEMKRTKSEIDMNTKQIVSAGTTSAVQQVTKAVGSSVSTTLENELDARKRGFNSYADYKYYLDNLADAK